MLSLNYSNNSLYRRAGHCEAAANQLRLYGREVAHLHRQQEQEGPISILDFGSGEKGVGRMFLEETVRHTEDRLMLYDPEADIASPMHKQVSIVSSKNVFGDNAEHFDIVHLSYVLCCMEPHEAHRALRSLQEAHPNASWIIIDYVLSGRNALEVLGLLQSREERKWIKRLGEEEFVRVHTRFSVDSLVELVRQSGISVLNDNVEFLDGAHMRVAITAQGSPISPPHTPPSSRHPQRETSSHSDVLLPVG